MAALTSARNSVTVPVRKGDCLRIPMAADAVILLGGMVCRDADGYAVAAADTVDYVFAGVAVNDMQDATAGQDGRYDNTGGSDGDMEVVVMYRGRARYDLLNRTPTQDMLFGEVYVADDQTVAVHPWDVDNDIPCGQIMRCPGTTLAAHPVTDMDATEVEIEFFGDPFAWGSDLTTTTAAATTTAQE